MKREKFEAMTSIEQLNYLVKRLGTKLVLADLVDIMNSSELEWFVGNEIECYELIEENE